MNHPLACVFLPAANRHIDILRIELNPIANPTDTLGREQGASINGSGFGTSQGTSTVTFNGTRAITISQWTSSVITVLVPSGASSGNVIVTVSAKASNAQTFTVLPTPTLSSVTPTTAAVGASVTLAGSNFGTTQGSGYVKFNGSGQVASISSWSNSSISAVVSSGATTGNVYVSASGVQTAGVPFTVAPVISGISPGAGVRGSTVTITGTNFGASQGSGSVSFAGANATISSWSDTSLTAVVPPNANSGYVSVTANGAVSNSIYFFIGALSNTTYHLHQELGWQSGSGRLSTAVPDAASTSFSSADLNGKPNGYFLVKTFTTPLGTPGFIPASSTVTLSVWMQETAAVANLYPYVSVSYLDAAGTESSFCSAQSPTAVTTTLTKVQLTCTTPWASTLSDDNRMNADVIVYNTGGSITKSVQVKVYVEGTLNGNYDSQITVPEVLKPFITSVSPSSASPPTPVTISGGQFGASQGSSTISFNGIPATPTAWGDTSITVPVPSNASTGPLVITVSGQSSTGTTFTVPSYISGISPALGPVGTSVTVSGGGFGSSQGSSSLSFNGMPAAPTFWSDTSIVAPVPIGAITGPVSVTVGGVVATGGTFTVSPLITGVSPTSGATGSAVRITGYNFGTSQGTITFNGVPATPGSWLNTSIVTTVPSGATTGPVVVTGNGVASNQISFTLTPTISSLSPVVGGAGTTVTISGLNFGATQGNSRVLFNGVAASPSSWSNTSIVAPVPANATTGLVTVVIGATSSNGLLFSLPPVISSMTPNSGGAGVAVTITGSGFGASQGTGTVTFNGTGATPTKWSGTTIVTSVPTGASSGQVVVSAGGLSSNAVSFTVGNGSVTGTVSQTSDGSEITGATVQAWQSKALVASATTAADGTYSIGNLPGGTYDLIASAPGFGSGRTPSVVVTANSASMANFSLTAPGTISGTVTKADGVTAISGAAVNALQSGEIVGTATTDPSGNYSIATLSAGTYDATATISGYTPQTKTGLNVTTGVATSANFSLAGQSVISYAYDASGRLVGVSDSQSDTAVYHYDAVGNIVSISRNASSQTSIIQLSPRSGPVGTVVTISGTGFSPTASQNTVSFNGTAALVTSATATQLVATVPSGATTGTVSITAPAGSATSADPFTVMTGTNVPTITSFNPTSGVPGTAVTITGTGFDSTGANDVVDVNASPSVIAAATTASLAITVPSLVTSGHISVKTKQGSATSVQDFYVPFGTHPATDIGFTGRIVPNSAQTASIGTAGKIGLMLFDGTAGQAISIVTNNGSFGSCNLILIDPFGRQISNVGCTGSGGFTDAQTLAFTGTYTIAIDPSGTTGSVDISLYGLNNVTGILTSGNPAIITTAYPGQNARLTFSGAVGQQVSLNLTGSTFPEPCGACTPLVGTILNPDGTILGSTSVAWNGSSAFLDSIVLQKPGTYTVVIDPQGASTGSVTVGLFLFNDQTGPITPNTSQTVTINTPGQNAKLTFTGAVNQQVSLNLTGSTFPEPCGACTRLVGTILNPDGTTLGSATVPWNGDSASFGPVSLAQPGTYTLLIDPQGSSTGTLNTSLQLQ